MISRSTLAAPLLAALVIGASACGAAPEPTAPGAPPGAPFGGPGPADPAPKACTQEAKMCPDGSAVSRTGPSCEFAPCPGEAGAAPTP